jgi:5-methylcytosine-specific restriction protein A
MPRAPKHCGYRDCTELVPGGTRYCDDHTGWKTSPRTASSAAAGHRDWKNIRTQILDRDQHRCQIRTPDTCTGHATVVDKIIPAARRPDLALNPTNLRAACQHCNDHKAHTTDRN